MKFISSCSNVENIPRLGGKGRALARLGQEGFLIPPWFAVFPEACEGSFSLNQEARIEIRNALKVLCPDGETVAVRSSASDEDGMNFSYAGQLESYLSVPHDSVLEMIEAVWKSGFTDRVYAYRRTQGINTPPPFPIVIVQRMVHPETAGVAFSADPVNGRRGVAMVAAVPGLGDKLVSGHLDADTWHVSRENEIVLRDIKTGVLSDTQVKEVAQLVRNTSRFFCCPQDIEWAYAEGNLILLQSRAITSIRRMSDPDGVLNIWDNSNIAESYSGVTTPLTFSFARQIYEGVYRQFCKIMCVPSAKIEENVDTFRRMLGMVRGRVYYNLLSWYRVLSLLPGYTVNRSFMEQMMGVKESVKDEWIGVKGVSGIYAKTVDGFHLGVTVVGLMANHFLLRRKIVRFHARLEESLAPLHPAIQELRPDELCKAIRDLESRLLTRWDAPLINDFFAMIFYGLLRKLTENWGGDDGYEVSSLQNDLLCSEGGIISTEPAHRVRKMAEMVSAQPHFVATLCEANLSKIEKIMATTPEFKSSYEAYLEKFGDRCLQELKLESPTLHDDPMPLLRSVGHFAKRIIRDGLPPETNASQRIRAEGLISERLHHNPFRKIIFSWVLKNARARVRDRENLRFERTRLFGRIRRIFVELGKRYFAMDLISEPRDIFYLTMEEAVGVVDGTSVATDLKGLIALRKAEFECFRNEPAPSNRLETHGPVIHVQNLYTKASRKLDADKGSLQGSACCPGVVRGPVRIICDPRNAVIHHGEILVAERTDPGWIMLFPAAAGVLVEFGSLLSHSAIVAREMGIPAIVSVSGLTQWLHDGEWVEMDGSTGVIRKIESEACDG